MSKRTVKKPAETLQKEDVVQAVVMCDTFNTRFSPLNFSKPTALFPLVNALLIDYTLEFLALSAVQDVILFCVSHADLIKDHIKQSKWSSATSPMQVTTLVSESCRSLGDAMRDIDAKLVVRGDFILLDAGTVANVDLAAILDEHKRRTKVDKGAVMTVLYKEAAPGHRVRPVDDQMVVAVDHHTDRLLFHQKLRRNVKKIVLPLELLVDNASVDVLYNLSDTNVCVCTNAVPQLFTDNFDFQTRDGFIRGLLLDEEILASSIYARRLRGAEYASCVDSWPAYQAVSHDVVHRWAHPFVPDAPFNDPRSPLSAFNEAYMFLRRNVYRQRTAKLAKGCVLTEDVVIGEGVCIGEDSIIERSVIGRDCIIGRNCIIRDSYIWPGVVLEGKCSVSHCVIAEGCRLSDVTLTRGCIIGPGVQLSGLVQLAGSKVVARPMQTESDDFEEEQLYDPIGPNAFLMVEQAEAGSDDEESPVVEPGLYLGSDEVALSDEESEEASGSSGDLSDRGSPVPDDTNMFYNEVVDSLARGYEDRLACDNLILEINSSRYAYNVSVKEVNVHVTRALLNLPEGAVNYLQRLVKQLGYFLPILENYVKRSKDAQMDCLQAIEEVAENRPELGDGVQKLLHLLYEKDVIEEAAILQWYQSPNPDLPGSKALRTQVFGFVKWLQEADEESDSDDSE